MADAWKPHRSSAALGWAGDITALCLSFPIHNIRMFLFPTPHWAVSVDLNIALMDVTQG